MVSVLVRGFDYCLFNILNIFYKYCYTNSHEYLECLWLCHQEPLQTLTLFSVAGELHSYSEVCEALSTLEVALGFLAMTGGEAHMQLSCYLEEVLQMGNQVAQHIVKVSLSEAVVTLSSACSLPLPQSRLFGYILHSQIKQTCLLLILVCWPTLKLWYFILGNIVLCMRCLSGNGLHFCSQVFSMCCLKHCVALWQLLVSLKSENMLRLKRVRCHFPFSYQYWWW